MLANKNILKDRWYEYPELQFFYKLKNSKQMLANKNILKERWYEYPE